MKRIKTHKIVGSKNNPRVIRDHKFEKLKKSISDFPEMLEKRPIICVTREDKKLEVIGGNMRFRVCQDLLLLLDCFYFQQSYVSRSWLQRSACVISR